MGNQLWVLHQIEKFWLELQNEFFYNFPNRFRSKKVEKFREKFPEETSKTALLDKTNVKPVVDVIKHHFIGGNIANLDQRTLILG